MHTLRHFIAICALTTVPLGGLVAQRTDGSSVAGDATAASHRIKIGASTLLGIPSIGVERPLARTGRTFQWDMLVSPWASVEGFPLYFVVGTAEWRAYRGRAADGWYAAVHAGLGAFQIQRWDYRDSTIYHEGANFMVGGSVGHAWRTRRGWVVDAYLGGGTVQSLYKSYDRLTGSRVDGAKLWNISGEILPYRTGLSIGLPPRSTATSLRE